MSSQPVPGDRLQSSGNAHFTFPGFGSSTLNYTLVATVGEPELITVGTGQGREVVAFPLTQTMGLSGTVQGQRVNLSETIVDYYASGLGIVKLVEDDGTVWELLSSTLNTDTDGDGLLDSVDNCPEISNAGQEDFEGDFIGDVCDPDDDNDGMSDSYEGLHGLDSLDASDAGLDPDGDGFINLTESQAGSDPFDGNSTPTRIVVGLGEGGGGYAERMDGYPPFSNQAWPRLDWPQYNREVGETRPALCDLDGDGRKELVLGMGSYPQSGGWLEVLDDAEAGYAHLEWLRVPWGSYNRANGETYPDCGDLDGDGRDELAIGLGNGGSGYVYLVDDATVGYVPLAGTPNGPGWLRTGWSGYNRSSGATHPVVGNFDGDGAAELAIGLSVGGQGWVQLRDDLAAGFAPLAGTQISAGWTRVDWSDYNRSRGETWPASCDLDGDGQDELVLGLGAGGQGWLQVLEGPQFTGAAGTPASGGWYQAGWQSYNRALGETLPSCGDLDGDGRDELLIGLGSFPEDGGYLQVIKTEPSQFNPLGWSKVNWSGYNRENGQTRVVVE